SECRLPPTTQLTTLSLHDALPRLPWPYPRQPFRVWRKNFGLFFGAPCPDSPFFLLKRSQKFPYLFVKYGLNITIKSLSCDNGRDLKISIALYSFISCTSPVT